MATAVTAVPSERASREEEQARFEVLDSLRVVLVRILDHVGDDLGGELGRPWEGGWGSGFIGDNLTVGKSISQGCWQTDQDLSNKLWPSEAGQLEESPTFLAAHARAQVLAARLLRVIAANTDAIVAEADELVAKAARYVATVEKLNEAASDHLRETLAMIDGLTTPG